MMLYLYVQQNQWIVITLLSGIALTLLFCLTYQAMWLPRKIEGRSEVIKVKDAKSFFAWLTSFIPWLLILLVLASVSYTIAEVAQNACLPPNW